MEKDPGIYDQVAETLKKEYDLLTEVQRSEIDAMCKLYVNKKIVQSLNLFGLTVLGTYVVMMASNVYNFNPILTVALVIANMVLLQKYNNKRTNDLVISLAQDLNQKLESYKK